VKYSKQRLRPASFAVSEFVLDFVVGDKSRVTGVRDCQQVPVAQQTTPRLKQPAHMIPVMTPAKEQLQNPEAKTHWF